MARSMLADSPRSALRAENFVALLAVLLCLQCTAMSCNGHLVAEFLQRCGSLPMAILTADGRRALSHVPSPLSGSGAGHVMASYR